jgi:N-acetylneuraminic acid mutarotase
MARQLLHRLLTPFVLALAGCVSISAAALAATVPPRPVNATGSNTWMLGAPAPTRQFTGAAAVIGTNIYLVGGETHVAVLGENDVYDTVTNKWSRARPMPTKRATLAAVALNGLVYAIGGSTFTGVPLATVEAYDPTTNRWSTKASLPTAVDSMTATVDDGFIYVVGGFNDSNGVPFGGVQVYDPTKDAWTSVASLNVAKSFAFTTTVGTQIVAAAGSIGTGPTIDSELYDPMANMWTTKSNALSARYAGCVGAIGASVYAAGGLKFSPFRSTSRELDRYDVAVDHWTQLRRMPFGMLGPASAVVNGRLYCIGGSPRYGQPVFSGRVQIYQP